MTTLLVVQYPSCKEERCNARCHHSRLQRCTCPCGGAYHGLQTGTPALAYEVQRQQTAILEALGRREQTGELWVAAYRVDLDGPLTSRRKGKVRAFQEPLPLK